MSNCKECSSNQIKNEYQTKTAVEYAVAFADSDGHIGLTISLCDDTIPTEKEGIRDMAKTTDKQLEYIKEWNKKNRKVLSVRLNKTADADLIEVFESIPNKSEWIRDCLRDYMEKNKK